MSGDTPPTIYIPGIVPMHRPVMAPPGALLGVPAGAPSDAPSGAPPGAPPRSALASGASFNNLLQALIPQERSSIQRPVFAASSRQAPLPAGYPVPTYHDPVMQRIKYMTDTFHAAATNDPTFYKIYCDVRNAESPYSSFPTLVFFLRLHLQVSWIDLLERHNRQNEVEGDTTCLISERKELIGWLVKRDQTLKPRAGRYLASQLARFAPLAFEPSQVRPLIALLDHLYVLEHRLFFGPKNIRAAARNEYRIQVVTYLDFEGGGAKIVEDVNISQKISIFELQSMLSSLTQNIQAAQLDYNYGFQSGGYHGHWVYWANKKGIPDGLARALGSEAQLTEMKDLLDEGQKVFIKHTKQVEIEENLQVADALGLGLDRPFEWCTPLPPGYTSTIIGEYPNSMEFSLLSGYSAGGGPAPEVDHRRGERSVLSKQHRFGLRKQQQKARAFEIRGKKV